MTDEVEVFSELDSLKQIATNIGITYSGNIGVETLKKKIEEAKSKVANEKSSSMISQVNARHADVRSESTKLVRVRVANMNPADRAQKGVLITVSNAAVGTLKKFVPFNVDFHIPQIMYNVMKAKKFRVTETEKTSSGRKVTRNIFQHAYSIEKLPQLSSKALSNLADDQMKRGAID